MWTQWQSGESTPSAGQLESLPSHQTMRILVHVGIEVIEDFLFSSVYFFFSLRML